MERRLTLVAGGEDLEVEVIERDDAEGRATLLVARSDWNRVVRDGLLHVEPGRANAPLDRIPADGPVEVDVVLQGEEGAADGWWALHAVAEVPLPPELAATGSLAEGVSFDAPATSELEKAWRQTVAILDEDGERA